MVRAAVVELAAEKGEGVGEEVREGEGEKGKGKRGRGEGFRSFGSSQPLSFRPVENETQWYIRGKGKSAT